MVVWWGCGGGGGGGGGDGGGGEGDEGEELWWWCGGSSCGGVAMAAVVVVGVVGVVGVVIMVLAVVVVLVVVAVIVGCGGWCCGKLKVLAAAELVDSVIGDDYCGYGCSASWHGCGGSNDDSGHVCGGQICSHSSFRGRHSDRGLDARCHEAARSHSSEGQNEGSACDHYRRMCYIRFLFLTPPSPDDDRAF